MKQAQVGRQESRTQETVADETTVDVTNPELAGQTDATLDAIDEALDDQLDLELLDFMDEVMGTEEEARQFVDSFINEGGAVR